METDEYERIAAVEREHWWYRYVQSLVDDFAAPWLRDGVRVLDAGCGPGGNGAWLARYGTVVGVDVAPDALRLVRSHWPDTIPAAASVEALPFADGAFDLVVCLTVLYSVLADAESVGEFARVLRTGGALLVVEPAFPSLRRGHDAVVHGRRRYRRTELAGLARVAGLHPRRATYACSFLAPAAAVLAARDRSRRKRMTPATSDIERRRLDRLFARLTRIERRVLAAHDVPFGTSAILLATKDY
jgi:SAM-dependent methyltransferase